MQVFIPQLVSPVVSFSRIFSIHQEHLFAGTPGVFPIHFFYCNVSTKNLLSLFLCFFKKSDALYVISTNWLLLIIIDKFTIIDFAPFSLVTKGAYVTFGKICLCVKSHGFIFSLIPYCTLSFKTERTIPLIFALIAATWGKFALLKFLLIFIFVISVLQLVFQKIYTY